MSFNFQIPGITDKIREEWEKSDLLDYFFVGRTSEKFGQRRIEEFHKCRCKANKDFVLLVDCIGA